MDPKIQYIINTIRSLLDHEPILDIKSNTRFRIRLKSLDDLLSDGRTYILQVSNDNDIIDISIWAGTKEELDSIYLMPPFQKYDVTLRIVEFYDHEAVATKIVQFLGFAHDLLIRRAALANEKVL